MISPNTETQNIEYKESWRDEYMKWIAGFANADGGVLYIGKEDSGKTIGLAKPKKLMEDIPNKIRNTLGITADVSLYDDSGLEYIKIEVRPATSPISYAGEFFYRSGATKHALSGASLTHFLLKKMGMTWDEMVVDEVSVSDLSKDAFEIFRKNALKSKRMSEADLKVNNEELLDKLNLLRGGKLTRAAVLLFHPDPEMWVFGGYVKIGFFEEAEVRYHDEIHGSLFEQADKTVDMIFTKYLKAWISYDRDIRVETFPFPRDGVREAVYNCLVHKVYTSGIPIQIRVFEDKIILANICKIPNGWTAETLMQTHSSNQFNPLIANVFYRSGFIESWGRGIKKICDACIKHGIPLPEYVVHPEDIMVTLYGLVPDDVNRKGSKDQINVQINDHINVHLNVVERQVLSLVLENPSLTLDEIASRISKSAKTAQRYLYSLREKNIIRRVGSRKDGHWEVIEYDNDY